jgi:hypothetical protein
MMMQYMANSKQSAKKRHALLDADKENTDVAEIGVANANDDYNVKTGGDNDPSPLRDKGEVSTIHVLG